MHRTHAEMSHRWSGEPKRVDVDGGAGYGRTGRENVPPSATVMLEKSRTDSHQHNDKYMLPDISVLRNRFLTDTHTGSGENTGLHFQTKDKGLHLSNTKIITAHGSSARSGSSVGGKSPGVNDGTRFDLDLDSETLFEVTNHAERFKYTRAKFAELEKQYLQQQEWHHLAFKKKAVRGMSLPLKMTLTSISGTDFAAAKSPTTSSSQRPEGSLFHSKGSASGGRTSTLNTDIKGHSVSGVRTSALNTDIKGHSVSGGRTSTLNTDFKGHSPLKDIRSPSLERPGVSGGAHVVRSVHAVERLAPAVKMKTAVSGEDSESDAVMEDVPDPKWLIQHFEEVARNSGSSDLRKVAPQKRQSTTEERRSDYHSTHSQMSDARVAPLVTTSHRSSSSPSSSSLGFGGIVITKTSHDSVSERPAWRQQDSLKRDENSAIASSSVKSGYSGTSRPYSSSSVSPVNVKGSKAIDSQKSGVELRKKRWEFHEANRKSFDEVEGESVMATVEAWKSKRRSINGRDSLIGGVEVEGKRSTTSVEGDALLLRKQGSSDSDEVSPSGDGKHSNHLNLTLPSKTLEVKTFVNHGEKTRRSSKSSDSEGDESGKKKRHHGLELEEAHHSPKNSFSISEGSLKSPTPEVRPSFDLGSLDRTGGRKDGFLVSPGSLKSPTTEVRSSFDLGSPDRTGSQKDGFLVSSGSLKSPTTEVHSSFDLGSPDRNSLIEIGSKAAAVGLVASSLSREPTPSNNLEPSEKSRSQRSSSSEDEGEKVAKDEKSVFITQPRDSVAAIRFVSLT